MHGETDADRIRRYSVTKSPTAAQPAAERSQLP